MSIFSWFSGLFSDASAEEGNVPDSSHNSITNGCDDSAINPANGLPMVGGEAGVDLEGNTFGTDSNHNSVSSGIDNDDAINPANGLPMVGGEGGVDLEGNTFGTDFSHDTISSGIDDSFVSDIDNSFGSGFDDSFSSSGGFDDW